jgi:hypothetical protein
MRRNCGLRRDGSMPPPLKLFAAGTDSAQSRSRDPVISDDASDARKMIAPVSSSSCPRRPSLIFDNTSSRKALFSKKRPRHRRFQERRAKTVDADIVWRKFDRHRLGETLHGVLRRAIDGAARGADVAHLGRNMVVKSASPHLVPKRIWLHRAGGLAARSWRRMGIEARIDLVEGCLRQARPILILSQQ